MSETSISSKKYEVGESTQIAISEDPKTIPEGIIEETLYGKNKPRRVTIDRKIVYDENK